MMIRRTIKLLPVLAVLTLIACGGGSGGSSGGSSGGGGDGGIDPPIDDGSCNEPIPAAQDTDSDGLSDCDEISLGTNPRLSDTDGDSFSDLAESVVFDPQANRTLFNPQVSDLARIAIDLTSVPQIELEFTESNGNTRSVATQHNQSDSSGVSQSRGGDSSRQLAIGHTVSIQRTDTVGVEVSVSPTDLGGSASYETSLSVGLEASRTQTLGSSVNWNTEQRTENTRTFGETQELSQTSGTQFTGGILRVTARVRNNGAIAYDLENLTLSAFIFDPARPFDSTPVANLSFLNGSFPTTSIANNSQSAPLNFTADLSLTQARRLLRDSSNLVIVPSTFRLLDSGSRSILLRDQDVAAQTATIMIDFGPDSDRLESHRVAVNRGTGDRSISALDAIASVLGFSISEGAGTWVFGNEGSARSTPAGLLGIDNVAMSETRNSYWYGAWNRSNPSGAGARTTQVLNLLDTGYNLADIRLRAGDTLSFVYVSDADRDAIPDRYEAEFGTDPDNADTDNDSLFDAIEIFGFTTNLASPPCDVGEQFLVTSNPLLVDSDGDGIDDATERANCDNPNFLVIANAGIDQFVSVGGSVSLSGSAEGIFSDNPDYTWVLSNGPDVLVNGQPTRMLEGRSPTFSAPDEVASLVFDLNVSVGGGQSSDQVIVQVQQDRNQAVYVGINPTGTQTGSTSAPYNTLEEAINAISPGDDLYVMTRVTGGNIEPYRLVNSLIIPEGTDMFGGYDENWIRNVDTMQTPVILEASADMQAVFSYAAVSQSTRLSGFALISESGSTTTADNLVALSIVGSGQGEMIVQNNSLSVGDVAAGDNATPGTSYGAYIHNIERLRFRDNLVVAGNGGAGSQGDSGESGPSGDNGSSGSRTTGGVGGSTRGVGGDGGRGGSGGVRFGGGGNGNPGAAAGSARGGAGGAGGNPGVVGRSGAPGVQGAAGSAAGVFNATEIVYLPANGSTGVMGTSGAGGGGGGGGDFGGANGGAGGGGGEGGRFGRGGTGGAGGGASIGLWITGNIVADVRDNNITAANGAAGGDGGRGGSGGSGGSGGAFADGDTGLCIPFTNTCDRGAGGARGGAGGRGGDGGDGSGGSGGPSIALFVGDNMAPIVTDNRLLTGNGGNGGRRGSSGNGGDSVAIFDADTEDGRQPNVSGNIITLGIAGQNGGAATDGGTVGTDGCQGESNCR